jgi:hypothetical protein
MDDDSAAMELCIAETPKTSEAAWDDLIVRAAASTRCAIAHKHPKSVRKGNNTTYVEISE